MLSFYQIFISRSESSKPKKSKPNKSTVAIPQIDPQCETKGKIFCDDDNVFHSVVLNQTNIKQNNNKYYKIQLIEVKAGGYCLFKSWGRVGFNGQSNSKMFTNVDLAVKEFAKSYSEKTYNTWKSGKFQKFDGKYHMIEVDTSQGASEIKLDLKTSPDVPSKLHVRVQELLKILFDVDSMKKTMQDYGLDTVKMPLGKLSKNQLMEAYKCLTELNNLINRGASHDALIEASNKFYTMMPHNFGMSRAPVISTTFIIQAKQEMIDNLLQIEVACKIMNVDEVKMEVKEKKNPLDAQYEAMKVEMEPLEHDSEEFKMIKTYMKNTHAVTHGGYSLELQDVFKVDRDGEKDRFKPFSTLHNRQLLWHGSRKTNFVGILSNGLRIAPPEAPVS